MTSLIPSKFVNCHASLYDWLLKRELSFPLEPPYPSNQIQDYTLPQVTVKLWERILFKLITGLDLRRLREMKIGHSPRFKQLVQVKKGLPTEDLKCRFNAASESIRLEVYFNSYTLESYWVDRELSTCNLDLNILAETINNYRLTWCQGKNSHPKETSFQRLETHPIESMISENVLSRLTWPHRKYDNEPQYDATSDTFSLVPREKSIYATSESWGIAYRTIANWAATSLEKRLKEDQEKRQSDPQYKLRFVHNEIYEERLQNLKQRQMVITACYVAGVVLFSLLGIVFFCQSAKKNKWM